MLISSKGKIRVNDFTLLSAAFCGRFFIATGETVRQ